jgi:hypothetical protein
MSVLPVATKRRRRCGPQVCAFDVARHGNRDPMVKPLTASYVRPFALMIIRADGLFAIAHALRVLEEFEKNRPVVADSR